MEFRRYLKERLPEIILGAAAVGAILALLFTFRVSTLLIILVSAVYLIFLIPALLRDFFRKRSFYQQLNDNLKELERKNLLSEIIPKPKFYEGQILYEVICELGKAMTEQITRSEQSVRDFKEYVEIWVHEAKIPVSSLLLKTYHSSQDDTRQIRRQLLRLDAYTEQILFFTRSEVAEKDFLIKSCSRAKIFGNAAARMREELQENEFEMEVRDLDLEVMTDSKWMEFVIGQLISNSIKYRAEGRERKLSVYGEQKERAICFHFWDNGIGIPTSDLPRIFEKSFTGENGRKREKSSGMGLYIAKNLCRKLGHQLSADSVQGEYTEFKIEFPVNDYYHPE